MTERTLVIVDTNVLLDVAEHDEDWFDGSQARMVEHATRLVINPMIYAELCHGAGDASEVDDLVVLLGLRYEEMPRSALFRAAQAYRLHRERGGTKLAPPSDFFIGAQAAAMELPILTRDVRRYRTYFPEVRLIAP